MHGRRCAALLGAVRALIAGRRLTLMELARSWPDALPVAASLKKLDRLLLIRERNLVAPYGWELLCDPRFRFDYRRFLRDAVSDGDALAGASEAGNPQGQV
jgi:hypothetical protein